MSTFWDVRPMIRSRTQPPTKNARPPAARTAVATSRARETLSAASSAMRGPDRLPAEPLNDAIGEAGSERVEQHETARLEVRIDLRNRMLDRARDRLGHFLRRLDGTER